MCIRDRIYRDENSIDEALIQLKELASEFKEISLFVEFINRSKRGLVR